MSDKEKTVIFIDFDGTLFPRRFFVLPNGADPVLVHMLNVFGKNGAKIVVHSAARANEGGAEFCRATLAEAGVNLLYVHEETTTSNKMSRWHSIKDWLQRHPDYTDIVVLDDEPPETVLTHYLHNRADVFFMFPSVCEDNGLEHSQVLQLSCLQCYDTTKE